jgi:hypothetical protein
MPAGGGSLASWWRGSWARDFGHAVALGGLLLAGACLLLALPSDLVNASLAHELSTHAVVATAVKVDVRVYNSGGRAGSSVGGARVIVEVSGRPAQLILQDVSDASDQIDGWYAAPKRSKYAPPLQVRYNPARLDHAMAAVDYQDSRSGRTLKTDLAVIGSGLVLPAVWAAHRWYRLPWPGRRSDKVAESAGG